MKRNRYQRNNVSNNKLRLSTRRKKRKGTNLKLWRERVKSGLTNNNPVEVKLEKTNEKNKENDTQEMLSSNLIDTIKTEPFDEENHVWTAENTETSLPVISAVFGREHFGNEKCYSSAVSLNDAETFNQVADTSEKISHLPFSASYLKSSSLINCPSQNSCLTNSSVKNPRAICLRENRVLKDVIIYLDQCARSDRFDMAGKLYATKIRLIPNTQLKFVKKLTESILLEAKSGHLNNNSVVEKNLSIKMRILKRPVVPVKLNFQRRDISVQQTTWTHLSNSHVSSVNEELDDYNIHSTNDSCVCLEKNNVFNDIRKHLKDCVKQDRFDIIGKQYAETMRSIPSNVQCLYAEKLIGEVLFKAELGYLDRTFMLSNLAIQSLSACSKALSSAPTKEATKAVLSEASLHLSSTQAQSDSISLHGISDEIPLCTLVKSASVPLKKKSLYKPLLPGTSSLTKVEQSLPILSSTKSTLVPSSVHMNSPFLSSTPFLSSLQINSSLPLSSFPSSKSSPSMSTKEDTQSVLSEASIHPSSTQAQSDSVSLCDISEKIPLKTLVKSANVLLKKKSLYKPLLPATSSLTKVEQSLPILSSAESTSIPSSLHINSSFPLCSSFPSSKLSHLTPTFSPLTNPLQTLSLSQPSVYLLPMHQPFSYPSLITMGPVQYSL